MFDFFPDWASLFHSGLFFIRSLVRREEKRDQERLLGKAFRDEDGGLYTVMLPSEMIHLSNHVIGLFIQLEDCRSKIRELKAYSFKCNRDHRKLAQKVEKLEDMAQMFLEQIAGPQERLVAHWYTIFNDHNLLDLTEDIAEGPNSQASGVNSPPIVTSVQSTIEFSLACDEGVKAMLDYGIAGRLMYKAQDRFDSWSEYYQRRLDDYESVIRGGYGVTRSQFDLKCLQEKRDMTSGLIVAEQAFEEAKQRALDLGVLELDPSLESGFADQYDDGYTLSFEQDMAGCVNRARIENWLGIQDNCPTMPEIAAEILPEIDSWSTKSVEIFDSVSVKAEHKRRKRIDRWRSTCERVGFSIWH